MELATSCTRIGLKDLKEVVFAAAIPMQSTALAPVDAARHILLPLLPQQPFHSPTHTIRVRGRRARRRAEEARRRDQSRVSDPTVRACRTRTARARSRRHLSRATRRNATRTITARVRGCRARHRVEGARRRAP